LSKIEKQSIRSKKIKPYTSSKNVRKWLLLGIIITLVIAICFIVYINFRNAEIPTEEGEITSFDSAITIPSDSLKNDSVQSILIMGDSLAIPLESENNKTDSTISTKTLKNKVGVIKSQLESKQLSILVNFDSIIPTKAAKNENFKETDVTIEKK